MALERVPADIRKDGGVARMSDPKARYKFHFLSISYQDYPFDLMVILFNDNYIIIDD